MTDAELLGQALDWHSQGIRTALATLAAASASKACMHGSLFAFTADGRRLGSVTSGCAEEALIERLADGDFTHATRLCFGARGGRLALPCGGFVEVVVETLRVGDGLRAVAAALARGEAPVRLLDLDTGNVQLRDEGPEFAYDGRVLVRRFGPSLCLLIIGACDVAHHLARFAPALGYRVRVCEPRAPLRAAWRVREARLDPRMPDDAVSALADARTAVLALSHDPRLDDMALEAALTSPAFYVGVMGSHKANALRRERLAMLGISETALARLHAPVGLPIGSRGAAEIAIAILAHLVAVRRAHTATAP